MGKSHNKNAKQKRGTSEVVVFDDIFSAIESIKRQEKKKSKFHYNDCYSMEEISEKLGATKSTAYNIVKKCLNEGACEYAGKRLGTGIDGRVVKTPVYRFRFKNKNGNKK